MKYLKSFNDANQKIAKKYGNAISSDDLGQLEDLVLDISDAGFHTKVRGYISYQSEDIICYDIIVGGDAVSTEVYDVTKSNYSSEITKTDDAMKQLSTLHTLVKELVKRVIDMGYYVGSFDVRFGDESKPYAFVRLFKGVNGEELTGFKYHKIEDEVEDGGWVDENDLV